MVFFLFIHVDTYFTGKIVFVLYVYSLHVYRIFGPFSHTMCSNDAQFGVLYETLEVPEARTYLSEA